MRTLPTALLTENLALQREPRVAVKIVNDTSSFWIVSHSDVTPGDGLDVFPYLVSTSINSQSIEPEKGFSTIGGMSITIQDQGFTDKLRTIDQADDSIHNNEAEVWMGFKDMTFGDYGKVFTFIVDGVSSGQLDYTLKFSDRQRFEKRNIFTPRTTKLFAVIEGAQQNDLTTSTVLDGSGVVEVLDASVLTRIEHDADWETDPSTTIGYFQIKGVDDAGNDKVETFSFTGVDAGNPNQLTGVTRSRFGTSAIEATGSVNGGDTEVEEFKYLDLSVPKLLIALLTGDLYGQAGETLPDHWHAGMAATDIDLVSFENIGDDLWNFPISFEGLEKAEAKGFIAREVLRISNLFFKVNQDGELELKRFASVPQDAAPVHIFDESEIFTINKIERDARHMRNRFLINWEWRDDIEKFVRHNLFVDQVSIDKHNVITDILTLDLKGIRNRSRDMVNALQSLAEGIRARYSNPAIPLNITVPMAYGLEIEVGDIVGVDLAQWPDYANTDNLASSFEVQSVGVDLTTQSMTFRLFGTSGVPTPIDFGEGADVVTVDHTGWQELSAALDTAGISYTESGGTLTITSSGTLQGGDTTTAANRYYYDGNVTVDIGITLTVTKNFVLDAVDVETSGATINAVGGASNAATQGYFGGTDLSGEAVKTKEFPVAQCDAVRRYERGGRTNQPAPSRSQIESFVVRVDESNVLQGLPESLYGNGGSDGADTIINGCDDGEGTTLSSGTATGGSGASGGGGIILICENLFSNSSTRILTDGEDSTESTPYNEPGLGFGGCDWYGGPGGPGYPGCLVVLLKRRASPLPSLSGRHLARVGTVTSRHTPTHTPPKDGHETKIGNSRFGASIGPLIPTTIQNGWGRDFSQQTRLVKYITSDTDAPTTPGVDKTGPAALPTAITLTEQINTPKTPLGNLSTVTVTATAPADSRYSYALFEYRLQGKEQWTPIQYGITNEATVTLVSDGTTYEFSARSVSTSGQVSTGRVIETITLSTVSRDNTDTNDSAILVPQVTGLALSNEGATATEWSGPAPEFQWDKTSIDGGDHEDLHLDHYRVEIYRTSDNALLRTAKVKDTFYTYSLDRNIKDTNGSPTRNLYIDVTAVASTNKEATTTRLTVSNPAPAAVTGVSVIYTPDGVELSYTPPDDTDFRGVKIRNKLFTGSSVMLEPATVRSEQLDIVSVDEFGDGATTNFTLVNDAPGAPSGVVTEVGFTSIEFKWVNDDDFDLIGVKVEFRESGGVYSSPILVESSSAVVEGLQQGTTYDLRLTSVDTLGDGASITVSDTTRELDAADVSGLGNWATRTSPVDLAFINDNTDNDAIPSTKIANLTVAKLTAGTVTVQIDLGTGVRLDGAGFIQTLNSGYSVFVGPVNRAGLSSNPVVLHDWDGSNANFWFDLAGDFSLGRGGYTYDVATDTNTFTGTINISGGSGIASLSDAHDFVGNKVVFPNLNFESGDVHWDKSSWVIEEDATNALSGTWLARRTATSGSAAIRNTYNSGTPGGLPVQEGDRVLVSGAVKTTSDAAFGSAGWRISWRDVAGTEIGVSGETISSANTSWSTVRAIPAAPASAAFAVIEGVVTSQTAGTVYIDNGYIARDATQDAIEAGTTIGSGYLHLNASTAEIAIGASRTYESTGIQLQYNSGTPRAYIGDGADQYLKFDGTDLEIGPRTNLVGVPSVGNNTDKFSLSTELGPFGGNDDEQRFSNASPYNDRPGITQVMGFVCDSTQSQRNHGFSTLGAWYYETPEFQRGIQFKTKLYFITGSVFDYPDDTAFFFIGVSNDTAIGSQANSDVIGFGVRLLANGNLAIYGRCKEDNTFSGTTNGFELNPNDISADNEQGWNLRFIKLPNTTEVEFYVNNTFLETVSTNVPNDSVDFVPITVTHQPPDSSSSEILIGAWSTTVFG